MTEPQPLPVPGAYLRWIAGQLVARLPDTTGQTAVRVLNGAGTEVFAVGSNGNLTATGDLTVIHITVEEIHQPDGDLTLAPGGDIILAPGGHDVFLTGAHLTIPTTYRLNLRDTALRVYSSADGQLDVDADVELELTAPTVHVAASTKMRVDGLLELDGDLQFVGAQAILTTADSLGLAPAGDLNLTPGGTARVRATSGVRLQSDDYVSQTTGWGISYAGAGDFRYLFADEMHAKAFVADLEQALAGGQIISKSVAPLAAVFTVPAAGANATLVVESFKGFPTFRVFVNADVIRLRQFDRTGTSLTITDCWGTVAWVSTDETNKTQSYTFTRSAAPNAGGAGTGSTIGIGTLALDYGTTGNGFLESNAIDGAMAAYAPYHQIVSWATHPATGQTVRTRLGNLRGIFNVASEYGLYAGAGVTDASKFLRISNQAVEGHNLPIKLYDGASTTVYINPDVPSIALGATVPTGYLVNNGIWMGKDTAYKFRAGTVSGGALTAGLAWDGTNLSIIGSITITGGSGYANISDKPTTLGAINAGEGTKLTGIAAGATVGATWGTNLYNIPGTLGAPAGSGLFLASTHMGYYTGGAWKTYIANDGKFAFAGDADNYVTWNGTALAVKGNIVMGDTGIFSQTDGKLLLGPGCERTATSWKALRGQQATIAGAFQTRAGAFPGTQGVVMEPGTTNYLFNGAMRDVAAPANRADLWTHAENCVGTPAESVLVHANPTMGWLQRLQYTGVAGDASAWAQYTYRTAAGSFGPTGNACLSLDVGGAVTGVTITLRLIAEDVANGETGREVKNLTVSAGLQRVYLVYENLPANTDHVQVQFVVWYIDNGDTFDVRFGAVNVEERTSPTTFCSGQLPWCSWTGTAYASTSTRTGTTLTVPTAGNIDRMIGSIVIWFRPLTAFNSSGGMLFGAGNADAEFDAYIYNGTVYLRMNLSTVAQYSPVTLDQEHCIIFEWDADNAKSELFFDGVSVATGNVGGDAPTLGTNMGIGYGPIIGTIYNLCGVITEYAVFGDLLTAAEVAAVFNLRRAMVDHGAIDTPGIYVVDGKWRLSSSTSGSRVEITPEELATYHLTDKINEIDSDGISVLVSAAFADLRSYQFRKADGAVVSRLAAYTSAATNVNSLRLEAYKIADYDSEVWIEAESPLGERAMITLSAYQASNKFIDLLLNVSMGGVSTITGRIDGDVRLTVNNAGIDVAGRAAITDGITAPAALAGMALLYVDAADGDLKCRFSDGVIKTIVTDT